MLVFAVPVCGASGAKRLPRLTLTKTEPIVVRGNYFAPRERVRLVVRATRRGVTTALADRRGSFLVRLRMSLPGCGKFSAVATGSRGSRATLVVTEECEAAE
jgi:hypothetical protein